MGKSNNLVIVESPSKAKTIGKYLGPGLCGEGQHGPPAGSAQEQNGRGSGARLYARIPCPSGARRQLIKELKAAAAQADTVYLATDPDREGEAISWHLKELLRPVRRRRPTG